MSGHVRPGHFRSGQVMTGHVGSGHTGSRSRSLEHVDDTSPLFSVNGKSATSPGACSQILSSVA